MRRIILDTDMGTDVDDALCLALALASPEIEVVAVTTVSRDTALRARISKKLLDLAGHPQIPVYAGLRNARSGGDTFAWMTKEGEGILDDVADESEVVVEEEPAVRALARLLSENDDLEVVAVGPMTNLAALLDEAPETAARIRRLTIMGGHIREIAYGGSVFPHGIDYNLCSDPASSVAVLTSGLPIRLVTGDVTLQTWMGADDLAAATRPGTPFHAAIDRAVKIWTPIQQAVFSAHAAIGDENVAFLHDPLALACLYDESFCTFEDLEIEATVQDGVFRTLERSESGPSTRPMRCATAVDAVRFRAHFVERLARFGPRA